ncbi:MAG: TOBE domain-containing protein [Thaumarchaeota archaeon]|nr:TOBE domain-containing protein [Candidatus Calditenuaceae archaeon]MCX8203330.1 TOBE domain-containing protein [Nitrososphaeria archaeon]MDW8042703.1 TOBE domain-containing protein [Nitrososphaerota archaeon]
MTVAKIEGRWVEVELPSGAVRLRRDLFELLDGIRRFGSVSRACEALGVTLKTGLGWIRSAEATTGLRLVVRSRGGRGGGGAQLTERGSELLVAYYGAMSVVRPGFVASLIEEVFSARNRLTGRVTSVTRSDVVSMVEVELEPAQSVRAVVTTQSVERLGLRKGSRVAVVVKATEVMLMAL